LSRLSKNGFCVRENIVGHTDYQSTANIYTHVRDEMLKKATVTMWTGCPAATGWARAARATL